MVVVSDFNRAAERNSVLAIDEPPKDSIMMRSTSTRSYDIARETIVYWKCTFRPFHSVVCGDEADPGKCRRKYKQIVGPRPILVFLPLSVSPLNVIQYAARRYHRDEVGRSSFASVCCELQD